MKQKDSDSRVGNVSLEVKRDVPTEILSQAKAARWYDANVEVMVKNYERFSFEEIHAGLLKHLPNPESLVLDVGSGTGRDAAALAEMGFDVTAVEPSEPVRKKARELHRHPNITWVRDSIPELKRILKGGLCYDVILLSAVWMHVAPSHRTRAFRRLVALLNPGGLIYITLRHGPHETLSGFWEVSDDEIFQLAREHGLFEVERTTDDDLLGRDGVTWTRFILRSPDEGSGALPLLRGIILNDKKSATYKLGLLRVLVQISQSAGGLAEIEGDETVHLPLGLFALYWLRLYMPLIDKDLPQSGTNRSGAERLGFAKQGLKNLQHVSPLNLRVGMGFEAETFKALHSALSDVCRTLIKMPMRYATYPGSDDPIFMPNYAGRVSRPDLRVIDKAYLYSFGTVRLPLNLWRATQKFGAWIEPAIIAEWKNLMKGYAVSQGRNNLKSETMDQALAWMDPTRKNQIPRERAKLLIESGILQHCVWSGKRLSHSNLDIDHCFPFSTWPCDDLWNLLPSSRSVNQHQKRDRLPTKFCLLNSHDQILEWWDKAYIRQDSSFIRRRFADEAGASLRVDAPSADDLDLEQVFHSVLIQQLHLKSNQQVPEWEF